MYHKNGGREMAKYYLKTHCNESVSQNLYRREKPHSTLNRVNIIERKHIKICLFFKNENMKYKPENNKISYLYAE